MNLHEAAMAGDTDRVKHLLDGGFLRPKANVNAQARDERGGTALALAAKEGRTETAALLIEYGADVNAQDSLGMTPLLFAAGSGRTGTAALLIDHGAEVNTPGGLTRWTPLHFAAFDGHAETGRLLLDRGADCSVRSHDGRTALHYAARGGAHRGSHPAIGSWGRD